MKLVVLILLVMLLEGCETLPLEPIVVPVPKTQIVPVPASMTQPCNDAPAPTGLKNKALSKLAQARRQALKLCDCRMSMIRALGRPGESLSEECEALIGNLK